MRPRPTAKSLDAIFPGKGQAMRDVLTSTKAVDENPAVIKWVARCFNMPSLAERRMCALDNVAETYGVEYVARGHNTKSPAFEYLNVGDPYRPTLIRFASGTYAIRCWGDIVERGDYD